ncbi:MAG: UDP-N-acetylmuramate--L-alanine ligase [Flavobacteriaceae bacterium]|nr:MAG: UDP-N-acetylmuramate--L-alanine ligase [Flavobacteriaceae bacterium]
MNFKKIQHIYFIGIGGIGMSSLVRYFALNGKNIAGYDKTPSTITEELTSLGIDIHFEDAIHRIPASFLNKKETLVVYTPAIPENHTEYNYFVGEGFTVLKRAEILGEITKKTYCLAVAGTHGKTTTSAILGHIMHAENATSFLGGIAENYRSNLIAGGDKISVVEADEFDRSFLQLSPDIACITSIDADHLDIYEGHDALKQSFKEFANKVTKQLVIAKQLEDMDSLTYAIEAKADYVALNVTTKNGAYQFDIQTPNTTIKNVTFQLPGRHNIMNALAAVAMADVYGISVDIIKRRLASFKGVQRRFSYKIKTDDLVLIDDYAHHPTEITAVESAVREMYPEDKILAVFQPHLFSRTRDFGADFAASLSLFDELLLLDIYPAREKPIEGITSGWLLDKVTLRDKKLTTKTAIVKDISDAQAKIILMLGAGDISTLVEKVKNQLSKTILL